MVMTKIYTTSNYSDRYRHFRPRESIN